MRAMWYIADRPRDRGVVNPFARTPTRPAGFVVTDVIGEFWEYATFFSSGVSTRTT